MEGVEFVNDLCCNYLTLPYEGKVQDFALRMMTENLTNTFLPMELRRMNGEILLYYNISGTQSMEILHVEKPMDRKMFQTFMWQLHEAIGESREMFLSGDGICLEPSMVFWNLDKRRWEFVYIPGRDRREINEVQREREGLAEFLVMNMDHEDKELAETVYRFYEEVCAGRMYPDFLLEKAGGDLDLTEGPENPERRRSDIERRKIESWNTESLDADETVQEVLETDGEETGEKEGKSGAENTRRNRSRQVILCLMLFAAIAITLLSGRHMPDMVVPGGAVSALLAAALLIVRTKEKKDENSMAEYKPEDEEHRGQEGDFYKPATEREEYEEQKALTEEKTVYMDISGEQERKLYGIGKFRRQKIFLDQLPCLIGKDKTMADHTIADASVSRMHARFFEEGETLWMQDLNSTNGTYHNGLRLRPNEKISLEPEDEIGFGKTRFVFR